MTTLTGIIYKLCALISLAVIFVILSLYTLLVKEKGGQL